MASNPLPNYPGPGTNHENVQNGSKGDKDQNLQSNLPLLFANGDPTSLETMTLVSLNIIFREKKLKSGLPCKMVSFQRHLQHFLIFMLKCERGCNIVSLESTSKPTWWPSDIPYTDSILKFQSKKGVRFPKKLTRSFYSHCFFLVVE